MTKNKTGLKEREGYATHLVDLIIHFHCSASTIVILRCQSEHPTVEVNQEVQQQVTVQVSTLVSECFDPPENIVALIDIVQLEIPKLVRVVEIRPLFGGLLIDGDEFSLFKTEPWLLIIRCCHPHCRADPLPTRAG